MAGIGSSRAAGTMGGAASIANGVGGATNSISQSLLLAKLLGGRSSAITPGATLPGTSSIPGGAGNAAGLLPGTANYGIIQDSGFAYPSG